MIMFLEIQVNLLVLSSEKQKSDKGFKGSIVFEVRQEESVE